jgi:Domain of unknown function (DUF4160)
MPVISTFYGMIIRVYHSDHPPPHFHVEYGEKEVWIEIASGKVLHGKLSPRLLGDIEKWRKIHKVSILAAWTAAQAHKIPKKILPLE